MKEQLETLVKYNLWANTTLVQLILQEAPSILDAETPSSFPSLRKTIFHIWDAEYIWLMRMKGVSLTGFPSKDYGPDTPPEKMLEISTVFVDFVRNTTVTILEEMTSYSNLKGELFSQPNWQIVMHYMNHSTFHRGQLVTMLKAMGSTKIPSTDLIAYLRTV